MAKMTSRQIEELLDTKKYTSKLWTYKKSDITSKAQWDSYYEAQRTNGITEHADLLTDMAREMQTLPTQTQFVERGVSIAKKWWAVNKSSEWNIGTRKQFEYRLSTSYISHVIEIHTRLRLGELFPAARVFSHDFLDYGLAVDIVMEDKEYGKRYYIHILKDSEQSMKYLVKKEKRDKIYINGKWESYSRDFTGHTHLAYKDGSDKCKHVNGIPLFRDEYLTGVIEDERVISGEDMTESVSQIGKFEEWLIFRGFVPVTFTF